MLRELQERITSVVNSISVEGSEADMILDIVNGQIIDYMVRLNPEVAVTTKDGIEVVDELSLMVENGEHEETEDTILEMLFLLNEKIDHIDGRIK
jgi:hypothetical protein